MELIKRNVHMDIQKSRVNTQLTLDDDYNIPETMGDVFRLLIDKGRLQTEDVKVSEDHVTIKGRLHFSALYLSENNPKNIQNINGSIPFEEFIHMEGIESGDSVKVTGEIENLSLSLINSRKLSIKAIISLTAVAEEIRDEETTVEIKCEEPIEYQKKILDIAEIAVDKRDIYRIRETFDLPSGLPNVADVLWEDYQIGDFEFKAQEQKITLHGEINLFILYEAEGEEANARWYETVIPFGGAIDCGGCTDEMMPDIQYEIGHQEIEVRPDSDGEERSFAIDMVLDLSIKLYREEQLEILADAYGVTQELDTAVREGNYRSLLVRNNGKCRTEGRLRIKNSEIRMLQICHSTGTVVIDETEIVENGIAVEGAIDVQILYVTTDDSVPFYTIKGSIPFVHTIDVQGIDEDCIYTIDVNIEQLAADMIDSEELEIRAVCDVQALVFRTVREKIISEIECREADMDKMSNLPGIVGYIAKQGDTLWQIRKKYYVPIRQIKEMNGLTSDELHPGDKLLIVKTIGSTAHT